MNVVAYYRTNGKGDFEGKVAAQKKAVMRFCRENGLTVVEELAEPFPGVGSGPMMEEFAKAGCGKDVGAVVVMDLDRIARSLFGFLAFYQKLARQGIGILSTRDCAWGAVHDPGQEEGK